MKRTVITLFYLVCFFIAFSQSTNFNLTDVNSRESIQNYLQSNIEFLSPIEGIYDFEYIIKQESFLYSEPGFLNLDFEIAIIKIKNNFCFIHIDGGLDDRFKIEQIGETNIFRVYFYDLSCKSVFRDNTFIDATWNIPEKIKYKVLSNVGSAVKVTVSMKMIKTFPTQSDVSKAIKSQDEITIKDWSGSGFAISSNGYIVTNNHVIENAKTIEVKGVNGNFSRKLSAEVVINDEKNDLSIIKINDPSFTTIGTIPYTFRQGIADVGENVFVLGYPMTSSMGEEIKLTNGIISSKTGFKGDISAYQVSVPVQPGNSGGPLFDKNGNILGVINAKHTLAENASYAIKVNYIKNLIELLPQTINQPTLNTLNGKALTDQVKIASNFTYLIVINDNGASYNNANSSQKKSATSEQNASVYYEKAKELWKNKDQRGALEQINLSIEASPNYSGSYYFRGYIYQ